MIAAVATTYNEQDIIGESVAHLRAHGVEHIYAADASTDATRDILHAAGVTVVYDNDSYHDQPKWIEVLAELARQDGAEWVIPFDADEFWYSVDGSPIPDALSALPERVTKVAARMWAHVDRDHREPHPKPLPKVAFRAVEGVTVHPGNHGVDLAGETRWGVLDLREIQFRSFEHLCEKSRDRVERIDPSFSHGYGAHQRAIHAMDVDAKRAEWDRIVAAASVYDPIP